MANLTGFKRDNQGAFIEKHPSANLQYGLDFTDYLSSGDAIFKCKCFNRNNHR